MILLSGPVYTTIPIQNSVFLSLHPRNNKPLGLTKDMLHVFSLSYPTLKVFGSGASSFARAYGESLGNT